MADPVLPPLLDPSPDAAYVTGKLYERLREVVPVGATLTAERQAEMEAAVREFMAVNQPAVTLGALAAAVHALHVVKGFYAEPRTVAHLMGLVMSELAEVIEHDREFTNAEPSQKIPEFNNEEEEVADAFLRLLDFAGMRKLRVGAAVLAKHRYNGTRPPLHNKRY